MRVFMKERMLEESVKGYEQYRQKAGLLPMTRAQRVGAAAHRERILEKYRMKDGISRIELWQAVSQAVQKSLLLPVRGYPVSRGKLSPDLCRRGSLLPELLCARPF